MPGKKYQESVDEWLINADDLASNSSQRFPFIICIDCSYSMLEKDRLQRVLDGLRSFQKRIMSDRLMCESTELCLISYQGETATEVVHFQQIDRVKIPQLKAMGGTPLSAAVTLALDCIREREDDYAGLGTKSLLPTLIIIGDGDDTGYKEDLEKAANLLKIAVENHDARVLCVTVGDKDKKQFMSLKKIAPNHKVLYLDDIKFNDFFHWLSASAEKASQSLEGEEINLLEDMGTWSVDAEE